MYRPTPAPALTTTSFMRGRAADPPSLGWMLLLAFALFALALPIVGPLDDHHFAERSHTHGHIYLDGRTATHQHFSDSGAAHWHGDLTNAASDGGSWDGAGPTTYLTDPTGSLLLAVLTAPSHKAPDALRPAIPRDEATNPLSPYGVRYGQPSGRYVAPLPPPPIA